MPHSSETWERLIYKTRRISFPKANMSPRDVIEKIVHRSYSSTPSYTENMAGLPSNYKKINKLGDLLEANYKHMSAHEQIRRNLSARLKNGIAPFPGIVGYESDVIPALIRAILARHDVLLIGEIGQAKTRIAECVAKNLLSPIPIVEGSLTNDIPTSIVGEDLVAMLCDEEVRRTSPEFTVSKECEDSIRNNRLQTRIKWVEGSDRYRYLLATPDISVKDLVGQIDAIKIAKKGVEVYDIESYSPGYLLQAHHGMLCIDELPVLDPRKQVALLSILQEGKFTTGSYPITFKPDVEIFATANPTDYTHSGRIIEPLADRLRSHIKTHYPVSLEEEMLIIIQETRIVNSSRIFIPLFILKTLGVIVQLARSREEVNHEKGVSVRMGVHSMELLISESERTRSLTRPVLTIPRFCDIESIHQAVKFELSEMEDSYETRSKLLRVLIGEAFKKVSLAYLGALDGLELQQIRNEFSEQKTFIVSQGMLGIDPSKSSDYDIQLGKFPCLKQVILKVTDEILKEQGDFVEWTRKHGIADQLISIPSIFDGELMASVSELVLEGLTWTHPAVLEKKNQNEYGLFN
jgi:magnesium chelatase subunit I